MATTDQLRAMDRADFGHVVLFDGVQIGFGDREGVLAYTPAGHTIRAGLKKSGTTLPESANLRTGQFNEDTATITIEDFYGDIAALFAAVDPTERSLGDVPFGEGTPVHPLSDLTGRPDLDGMNIGTERIGANGARHQFPAPTGYTIGGDHSIAVPGLDLAGAPVSEQPIVWAGRRVVVYRCYRDHITYPGSELLGWRPFDEAIVLWHGTVRDEGDVQGRRWRLECDGPGSWLRKPLGLNFAKTKTRAVGSVTLSSTGETREDGMAMTLQLVGTDGVFANYGSRLFVTDLTGTTADEIREEVIAELVATAAATGADGVWGEQANHFVAMTSDGTISIAVDAQVGVAIPPGVGAGVLNICLHKKVWAILGFDVEYQRSLDRTPDDPRAIEFSPVTDAGGTFNEANDFGPDYWVGYFPTGRFDWPNDSGLALSNNGVTRPYRPLYSTGTTVLLAGLNEGLGQIVRLGDAVFGGDGSSVAHPGQLARAVDSSPADPTLGVSITGIGGCDRTGWWLFTGKRRMEGTEEIFDEAWVGRACWVGGTAQQDGLVAGDTIIVMEWLDAALFGYPPTKNGGTGIDWIALDGDGGAEGQIEAQPLIVLSYQNESATDLAHIVLQRLLLTSGTCIGFTSYSLDPAISIAAGDNEPAAVPGSTILDAEIAPLGLGIPEDFVAAPADWEDEVALVEDASILDVKVGIPGGFSSADVIRALMQPIGWCWHLRGGRYGVFCPAHPLTLEDVEVVLDRSVKVAEYDDEGERVDMGNDLRKWAAIDEWAIDYDARAGDGKAGRRLELNSPDRGLRYRPGGVRETVPALFHHEAVFAPRLDVLARWWSRRHFEVRGYRVPRYEGEQCRLGTIVEITDPELVDVLGSYGITDRVGIVTSASLDFDDGIKSLDILVIADRSATPRMNAPFAQGLGFDDALDRLRVSDDWAGFGNGWADAARFLEPEWSSVGGDMRIVAIQWDGNTWAANFFADVTGVSTTVGAAYLQLANITGTYYRDMDTWILPASALVANGAWVDARFAPIADEAGEWVDDAAATQPYIPWEE